MAEEFLKSALRFSTNDIRYQAQATFLLAGLRERSGAFDDALTVWKEYKLLEAKLPPAGAKVERGPLPARVYVTTADQRTEAITKRHKLGKDYAAIKERFQQDVKEAEAATGETAGGKPPTTP